MGKANKIYLLIPQVLNQLRSKALLKLVRKVSQVMTLMGCSSWVDLRGGNIFNQSSSVDMCICTHGLWGHRSSVQVFKRRANIVLIGIVLSC